MKKFIAPSLKGPWKEYGIFAPKDSLTWNSQSTFVLPIIGSKETKYLFMGDRWTFPRQNSAATYVWQPLIVSNNSISLPDYKQSWIIDIANGTWSPSKMNYTEIENTDTKTIQYSGSW